MKLLPDIRHIHERGKRFRRLDRFGDRDLGEIAGHLKRVDAGIVYQVLGYRSRRRAEGLGSFFGRSVGDSNTSRAVSK